MHFPLELRFKLLALASQIYVRDAAGTLVLYVRQKMFKLREDVTVYGDEAQAQPLYSIRADRILDISAQYTVTDAASGSVLGALKRQGMRSFWRAHYDIQAADGRTFTVREESVWVRILDGVLGQVPVLGALTGYFLHAAYRFTRAGSTESVMRVVKRPALFEGRFQAEGLGPMSEDEQRLLVLCALMMLLLERSRG